VKEIASDSEEVLLGQIEKAARACQTVPELTAVEALRHKVYKDSNSYLRSKCSDLERRLKAVEDLLSGKAERKAQELRRRQEEENKRKADQERLRRQEEERKLKEEQDRIERNRKEEQDRIERLKRICSDSKIMNEQYKRNLDGFFERYKNQI